MVCHCRQSPMAPEQLLRAVALNSLILGFFAATATASAGNTMITLGFPRYAERDSPHWMQGMQVAIDEANELGLIPGYNVSLTVGHIPSCSNDDFEVCVAEAAAAGASFLAAVPNMTTVMTPDWWIADPVIAAAAPYSIPVVTPKTFGHSDTPNVVNLNQPFSSDISHLVAYMLGAHECAQTGIIVTHYMMTMDPVERMQQAFVYGGYDTPPYIFSNVTADRLREFVLGEDADRHCFIILLTHDDMWSMMRDLKQDPRYSPSTSKFFAFNNVETGVYAVDGDTSVFDSFYIARHTPSFHSNTTIAREFLTSYARWQAGPAYAKDAADYDVGETIPTEPSESAFATYLATRYIIEAVRVASKPYVGLSPRPVPPASEVLNVAYTNRIYVGGVVYHPLIDRCPDLPLDQLCFCNVAARTTFTFKVNGSTGLLYQIQDDPAKGEHGVANSILSSDKCTPDEVDLSDYPISIAMLLPSDWAELAAVSVFRDTLQMFVVMLNNQVPAPARPFRVIEAMAPYSSMTNENLESLVRRTNPFLIAVAMGRMTRSSSLIMFPHADTQNLEDPPLAHYVSGDENMLDTLASVADCIHALVAYYAEHAGSYTGLSMFATTEAEAALMLKSINTFQMNFAIVVETDASKWASVLTGLLTASANPFVITSSHNGYTYTPLVLDVRRTVGNGMLAFAAQEGAVGQAALAGDIFVVSVMPAWWTPSSVIGQYLRSAGITASRIGVDSTLVLVASTFGMAHTISQQAVAASSSAATILYESGTVTVADVSFGPYSNATCTKGEIEANERDRTCQCYKGPRNFYVHSVMDIQEGTGTGRTGGYRYTMSTCGVKYAPYVAPAESISSGAIAGIVVACVVVVVAVIAGTLILVCCCVGRRHWSAPHDSTKPFAMVFTDIQNSTGLWARTPGSMSVSVAQHHALIRKLISRHSGYEVKTIGDSFMVAFKDINKAAMLALDIQSAFYDTEWPKEVDANYTELISEAMCTDKAMGCMLGESEEQYLRLWNGLRVRVGVHYGIGDIKRDPVSMGFDYYGTVVNTAARVEGVGHGGQVLLTEEAFQALDPQFVADAAVQVIDLGPQPLRGLDTGVQLRQLTPDRFHERRFPPLRLDVEHIVVEAEKSSVSGSDTTGEVIPPDVMAQRLAAVPGAKVDANTILLYYNFLNAGFSAAPEKWRRSALKELGKAWSVEVGHGGKNATMKGLMQIVMKMERAARNLKPGGSRRNSSNRETNTAGDASTFSSMRVTRTPLRLDTTSTAVDFNRQASSDVAVFSVPASPAVLLTLPGEASSPFENAK